MKKILLCTLIVVLPLLSTGCGKEEVKLYGGNITLTKEYESRCVEAKADTLIAEYPWYGGNCSKYEHEYVKVSYNDELCRHSSITEEPHGIEYQYSIIAENQSTEFKGTLSCDFREAVGPIFEGGTRVVVTREDGYTEEYTIISASS